MPLDKTIFPCTNHHLKQYVLLNYLGLFCFVSLYWPLECRLYTAGISFLTFYFIYDYISIPRTVIST